MSSRQLLQRACSSPLAAALGRRRRASSSSSSSAAAALILGVYGKASDQGAADGNDAVRIRGTDAFHRHDERLAGRLSSLVAATGRPKGLLKAGNCRFVHDEKQPIVLAGIGACDAGFDSTEELDVGSENVRTGVAAGVRSVRDLGLTQCVVDTCRNQHAAAEGAHLAAFAYDELKSEKELPLRIEPHDDAAELSGWQRGQIYAEAQNLARRLMETPANRMTPSVFADQISQLLVDAGAHVDVFVHERAHCEEMQMGAFLSVANGAAEPLRFVEVHCRNQGESDATKPIVLIGKGVTFDSGGISIKPSANMDRMRGDMGGAAVCAATLWAAIRLGLPLNLVGLIPLCENMPGSRATRPGDVVRAMNGKTIQVDNTDAEGRLLLADALAYSQRFSPDLVVDMATLTGAMDVALGKGATGVFSNCITSWARLKKASEFSGDRVWRMPLFDAYATQLKSPLADVNNIATKERSSAGACTAAAFLSKFVPERTKWMHLDIAGVMDNSAQQVAYLSPGMSGRPTRTLIEFLRRYGESYDDLGDEPEIVRTRNPRYL